MTRVNWMALAFTATSLASMTACDDGGSSNNGGNDGGADMTTTAQCPGAGQSAPCCYRTSNANRAAAPELRMSGMRITKPAGSALTFPTVTGLLQTAFNEDRFNWLVQIDVSGSSNNVTIKTGYGKKNTNGSFEFVTGMAPTSSGDADRWDPVTLNGTLVSNVLASTPLHDVLTVPIFPLDNAQTTDVDESLTPIIELPLRDVEIVNTTLSESLSCIGSFSESGFDTTQGTIRAYIQANEAMAPLMVPEAGINSTLCAVMNLQLANASYCTSTSQADWAVKLDSICNQNGCTQNTSGTTDACDPATTCNAWRVETGFSAQGAEVL